MPELPEVETTKNGLNKTVVGKKITDVWTSYASSFHNGKENIKNTKYFPIFKQLVLNQTITGTQRRGKNILISLSNGNTIHVHMKMTGHFLYGKYEYDKKTNKWHPKDENLKNPFSRHVRLVFSINDDKCLAFSDMRKFAKVCLIKKDEKSSDIENLGAEPLEKSFSLKKLTEALLSKPQTPLKTVLMDQTLVAGIGNIYSDEILWASNIHPLSKSSSLNEKNFKDILKNTKSILTKSIKMGGDSMSDYRNIYGEKGNFQNAHKVYRKVGEKCAKKNCNGIIKKIIIGGRSTHFCPKHQKLI